MKKRKSKKREQEYLFCGPCPHFKTAHGARGCMVKGCECKEKKPVSKKV